MERDSQLHLDGAPDTAPTEVVPRARRRRFTAAYQLQILKQADACEAPATLGALLRREGLYASHLSQWRMQRYEGVLAGGHQEAREVVSLTAQLEAVQTENGRFKDMLRKTETIIED